MNNKQREIGEKLGLLLIKTVKADILDLENDQKYKEAAREFNKQPILKRYIDFFIVYYWVINKACGIHYNAGEAKLICEAVSDRIADFLQAQSQKRTDLKDYVKEKEEIDLLSQQFAKEKVLEITPGLIWDGIAEKRFFDYNNAGGVSTKFVPVAARLYKHIFGSEPRNDFDTSALVAHFTQLLSKVFVIRIDSPLQAEILKYSEIIETNPGYAKAYYNRAVAYFAAQDYDRCWRDVRKAKQLGCEVDPEFLGELKRKSGREE